MKEDFAASPGQHNLAYRCREGEHGFNPIVRVNDMPHLDYAGTLFDWPAWLCYGLMHLTVS